MLHLIALFEVDFPTDMKEKLLTLLCLLRHRWSSAAVPRDKIYSLLGQAIDVRPKWLDFVPDYRLRVEVDE